jgi:dipeptidyl aminopeptidase/acylaminoacyl peptidase
VLLNAFVFGRWGTDENPEVRVVYPGETGHRYITDGYALAFGSDSRGRLPMVIGEIAFPGTPERALYNQRLVMIVFPDLRPTEVAHLTSYYPMTSSPLRAAEVPTEVLYVAEVAGWSRPAWSPDGRYLAFVGAIEGPTSDLYVYDSAVGTIERLTSGPHQAAEPVWSPDGRGVLHYEYRCRPLEIEPYVCEPRALWWTPISGAGSIRFADDGMREAWPLFEGWLDEQRFVFLYSGPGTGDGGNLLMGDVSSGSLVRLLDGVLSAAVLEGNDTSKVLAVTTSESGGRRLVLIDGQSGEARPLVMPVTGDSPSILALSDPGRFLVAGGRSGLLMVRSDGTTEVLRGFESPSGLLQSPDGRRAIGTERGNRLRLYEFGPDGRVSADFGLEGRGPIAWRPDGGALLVFCSSGLSVIAQPPDWATETRSGGCPAWYGWHALYSYEPTGIIWVYP